MGERTRWPEMTAKEEREKEWEKNQYLLLWRQEWEAVMEV